MAYEQKPGTGSAFKNENKAEDWHADFKGKLMLLDGSMCWIDVTKKRKQDGEVYVSVKLREMKPREDRQPGDEPRGKRAGAYEPPPNDGPADDVPF